MKLSKSSLIGIASVTGIVLVAAILIFGGGSEDTEISAIPVGEIVHIHGIAVDPNDSDRLLLATHEGIYRTSPDGADAVLISEDQNDYMGFSPHPTDDQIVYASGHPTRGGSIGVMISRDGGRTWQQLSQGAGGPVDFHAMTVSRADPDVMYGHFTHSLAIQVSRGGGSTWTVASTLAGVNDIAASAVDPDIVYAATEAGLRVSRDGGRTWEPTDAQGQPATMVEVAPDGTVYAFIMGTGLVRAPAAALAWTQISSDIGAGSVLLHFAVHPDDPNRFFAVDNIGRILSSSEGGLIWAPVR